MSNFFRASTPIAAYEHSCSHCRGLIGKGERYRYSVCLFNGSVSCTKSHIDCYDAWYELNFSRDMRGIDCDDGAVWLCEDDMHEPDDKTWMLENYPAVAERLGWPA